MCNYLVAYYLSCSILLYNLLLPIIVCYVTTDILFRCCVVYYICVVVAGLYYTVSLDKSYLATLINYSA